MNKIFVIFIFIIYSNLLKVKTAKNTLKLVPIKFKIYHPLTYNRLYNKTGYDKEDFIENYHFSKIYLEMEAGDENSFKENKNQTINVFVNLNESIFSTVTHYFKKYNIDNMNKICFFNTSKSSTFVEDQFYFSFDNVYSLSSYAKEYFKIYTDLNFINNNITRLNFVNTIEHKEKGVCGNFGLTYTLTKYENYNFLHQLYKNLNLSEICYFFNYTNSAEEGIFIVGNMPHIYLPKKYSIDDLLPLYSSNPKEPKIFFDEMKIEGYNMENTDEQFTVLLTPDIEGFEFPEEYFEHVKKSFFEEYINKSICHIANYDGKHYEILYCDADNEGNFGEKNIKLFPKIYFNNVDKEFLVSFDGNDLFYFNDNKYFFKILKNTYKDYFSFGRLFFQKYIAIFNFDKKQIYFYKNNIQGKDKGDDNKSDVYLGLMIASIILAIVLFILGLFLGKKIFEKRNRKAYELHDDDYQYKTSINDEKEKGIISQED